MMLGGPGGGMQLPEINARVQTDMNATALFSEGLPQCFIPLFFSFL
jgi:hypothetical protein